MPTNKKKFKKLIHHPSKMTGKRLAEACPESAQLLEEKGQGVSDQVVEKLTLEAVSELSLTEEQVNNCVTNTGQSVNMFDMFFSHCAQLAVPGTSPPEIRLREAITMQMRFFNQLRKEEHRQSGVNITDPAEATRLLKSTYDSVVDQNREEIVNTCYRGDEAAFLRHCKMSPQEFEAAMQAGLMADMNPQAGVFGEVKAMQKEIQKAAREVAFGMHKTTWICWQCGGPAKRGCTRCHAAKYCSRECQVKQWKDLHKHTCNELKLMHASFVESVETIDEAFAYPEAHEQKYGMPPSVTDFLIAKEAPINALGLRMKHVAIMPELIPFQDLEGPSITYFYSNLKRVIYDGFWMIPRLKTKLTPKKCDDQYRDFLEIALALSYDYSGLTQDEAVDRLREKVEAADRPSAMTMSPEEWLYNYDSGERCDDAQEEEGYTQMIRKQTELKFINTLRDLSSKNSMVEMCKFSKVVDKKMRSQEFDRP